MSDDIDYNDCPFCTWHYGDPHPRIAWLALTKHYALRHPFEVPPDAPRGGD